MHMTDRRPDGLRARFNRIALSGSVALCILIVVAFLGVGCARPTSGNSLSPADRDIALRQIAAEYARSGDLAQAQVALSRLGVANPAQLLLTLAEADLAAGQPRDQIEPMARLAEALGQRSPKLIAYLEPTAAPTPTPLPPTATLPPPTEPPSPTVTARPATETPTPEPPTATPAVKPQQPRVVADGDVNLRSGPGRAYPIVGRLRAGQETAIVARNANGDWWQVAWDGPGQAWVAGTVVRVLGPIDTVAVAEKIPAPPPTATRAPQPTAAAPAPQNPGVQYVVASLRLRAVGEHSQRCDGGDHNIFVTVVDSAGNPLD
ncbi:MAG: SH3 domain-containing protein, partial [Anaerolineae bacterium]|nr:SH3 domain-containing protein [Anaerolineae bacterium]